MPLFLIIRVSLPLIVPFLFQLVFPTVIILLLTIGISPSKIVIFSFCSVDYRLSTLIFYFLYFQLVFPALIVLFHTVGVFPSPIVIFSFLLCGLPSFDSNLLSELCRFIPFRFFAFCFFAFCLFAFSLLLSCAYQKLLVCRSAASWLTKPKTRS